MSTLETPTTTEAIGNDAVPVIEHGGNYVLTDVIALKVVEELIDGISRDLPQSMLRATAVSHLKRAALELNKQATLK